MKNIHSPPGCLRRSGLPLVELIVTGAIIGILAAIALPTYETYVRKARRVDARSAVLDMAARQERYFSVHNKYTQTAGDLGYSALPQAVGNGGSSFYQLSVTGLSQTPTAKATPTGVQIEDGECYAYAVNQRGLRGNQDAGGNTLNAGNCW